MPSYSPTSSPKYAEIQKAFDEHKEELKSEKMTRNHFYTQYALKIDPDLNVGSFYLWLGAQLRGVKDRMVALVEEHFLRDYEKKTPDEKMAAVDKMQTEIRYFAKKLFHAKIYEFIENPESANKLKFTELQKLYKMIREEESREREIALKTRDTKRKDIFGIFAMMTLAKQFNPEELGKIEQLVNKRIDGQSQLQSNSGPDTDGSAKGAETAVPRPSESPGVGEI